MEKEEIAISEEYGAKSNPSGGRRDYARLTFMLSVIGFLGSIGFYFGVLREVYGPTNDAQKIEQLEQEKQELQQTINVLIHKGEKGE